MKFTKNEIYKKLNIKKIKLTKKWNLRKMKFTKNDNYKKLNLQKIKFAKN